MTATQTLNTAATNPVTDTTLGEFTHRLAISYNRLAEQTIVPQFTEEFILADVTLNPDTPRRFYNFSGDLSGRYIEVMSLFPDQNNAVNLHELVGQLIRHQRPDGRFGRTDLTFVADEITDQHMALLWGNGRLLVGLTTYFQQHGNDAVLNSARRLGDFLLKTYEACSAPEVRQRLEGLGAFGFICFTQLNEGLVLLTRCTGNADYATFAAEIYPLLPPRGDQHSHGYLTTLRGVVMQYDLTGDQKHLDFAVTHYRDLLSSPDFLVWGGVKEYFGEKPLENRDEGCSEADFFRLSVQLFAATGDTFYLEQAETCLLNALYFNQYSTGDFGHHHCDAEGFGFRPNYRHCSWWCCTMHGLRAFYDVQQAVLRPDGDGLALDLFLDGRFETNKAVVTIRKNGTTYNLTVQPKRPEPFGLNVRIPTWVTSCTYQLNGNPISPPVTNGYARIECSATGDYLSIELQYRLTLRNESLQNVPFDAMTDAPAKLVLFCGPYLLVADDQADPAFVAEPLWENVLYLNSLTPAPDLVSRLGETYQSVSYKHQGFPGIFQTTLRPMSEMAWGNRGFMMAWLFFVSGRVRDMRLAGNSVNIPAGNYVGLVAGTGADTVK
ncbi:MAG: glycoside hydrolase family 127 protein [Bacteroidetes bacterium]|nr:glycoside hydrolase family 127 protein [Fibrella sp.]